MINQPCSDDFTPYADGFYGVNAGLQGELYFPPLECEGDWYKADINNHLDDMNSNGDGNGNAPESMRMEEYWDLDQLMNTEVPSFYFNFKQNLWFFFQVILFFFCCGIILKILRHTHKCKYIYIVIDIDES